MATFNAGAIEANLALGRSAWTRDLNRVQKEIADLEKSAISVLVDADIDNALVGFDTVETFLNDLDSKSAEVGVDAEVAEANFKLSQLDQRLDALDRRIVTVQVYADTDNALVSLDNLERTYFDVYDNEAIVIDVDANTAPAVAKLEAVELFMNNLQDVTIDVNLQQHDIIEEFAEVEAVIQDLEALSDLTINLDFDDKSIYDDVNRLVAEITAMQQMQIDIGVDMDQSAFLAQAAQLEATKKALEGDIDIPVNTNRSAWDALVGAADSQGGGHMGLLRLLLISVIGLLPVLAIGLSVAGTAVVGLVGALAAAAGPAIVLAGGLGLLIHEFNEAKDAGELTPIMEHLDAALSNLSDTVDQIVPKISESGFNLMADAVNLLAQILPTLVPLFNATADAVDGLIGEFSEWVSGPEYQEMIDFFSDFGVDMLVSFIRILGNLIRFFGNLFSAMEPFIREMVGGLEDLTGGWADWAANLENNDAFQHWLDVASEYGPMVLDMLGSLLDALMAVGHALEPFAGPALTALTDFFDLIANMDSDVLGWIIVIFGALFVILNTVVPLVAGLVSNIGLLVTAFSVVSGPVILIAALIGGLIALLIYMWQTNDEFRDKVIAAWQMIQEYVKPIIEDIVNFVKDNWGPLKDWIKDVWEQIQRIIIGVVDAIVIVLEPILKDMAQFWQDHGDTVLDIVKFTFKLVGSIIKGALDIIEGLIKVFTGVLTGDWSKAWDGLKQIVSGALGPLKTVISGALDALGNIWSGIKDRITGPFRDAINAVIDMWNNLEFSFPGIDPPGPGPKIDGFTIGTPNIPHVAKGGIAYDDMLAVIGDSPGEPEVIQPLSKLQELLDTNGNLDEDKLAAAMAAGFREVLPELAALMPGGVRPEDLERLIEAASVSVQIDATESGGSIADLMAALMFQFRLLGYGGKQYA